MRCWILISILPCLILPSTTEIFGQSQEKIYSLFILNFAKGISWPSDNSAEFVIDVLGYPPLAGELSELTTTARINGKRLVVREISDITEIRGQILFLPSYKSKVLSSLVKQTEKSSVLIVSNTPGTAKQGGSISFVLSGGKLTYEINVAAIEKRGLKVGTSVRSAGLVVN
jgi:hypothetical protein